MIPRECRRLAEVDFPIEEGSELNSKGHMHNSRIWGGCVERNHGVVY